MKKILFIILGLIALPFIIVGLIIVLAIDGSKPPVKVYRENESFSIEERFNESLTTVFDDAENNDLALNLSQDELNVLIFQMLQKQNPNYLIDDDPENQYFLKQSEQVGVVGVWTTVHNDGLTIKVRTDLKYGITFKTSFSIRFKLAFNAKDDPNFLELSFSDVKLGNLPLPRSLVNPILKNQVDLKSTVEGIFKSEDGTQYGTFDVDTWTIRIDKMELVKSFVGSDDISIITLVKILTYNKLFDLRVEKKKVDAELKTSSLYLDEELAVLQPHERIYTDAQREALLSSKMLDIVISALDATEDDLYVNLSEKDINRLLDYYTRDSLDIDQTFKLGDKTYRLDLSTPTVTIDNGEMFLNLKLSFSDVDSSDPNKKFITTLKVELIPDHHEVDLHFNLGKLYVGKDIKLDEEDTQQLLDMFGGAEAFQQNVIIISQFLSSFATDALRHKDTEVKTGHLKLTYTGKDDAKIAIINDIQSVIVDVVQESVGTYPSVAEEYLHIKDKDRSEIIHEEVKAVIDAANDLEEAERVAFRNKLFMELVTRVPQAIQLIPLS